MKKTLIITGTHHTPAIELIRQLQSDRSIEWQIHYIGHLYPSETHIQNTIIPKLKIPFHNLDSGKFERRFILKSILNSPKILFCFLKSLLLIHQIKPDLIVSFGGYVSVPVIFASFIKNIPSVIHEQTQTISLSTYLSAPFVKRIALSFPTDFHSSKSVITGNLLRHQIYKKSTINFKKLKHHHLPLIYITGGNQGSQFINQIIQELVPQLTKKYLIIHQTGKNSVPPSTNYFPHEYIGVDDIGWVLQNASLVISRAGANICQELDALDKKSILIPLPFSQQNEQLLNAQWLQQRHPTTTIILPQDQTTFHSLFDAVNSLKQVVHQPKVHLPTKHHPFLKLIYEIIN